MTKSSPRKVRDTWITGIRDMYIWTANGMKHSPNADWVQLVINHVDAHKFKPGDSVRVTVERLSPRCGERKK